MSDDKVQRATLERVYGQFYLKVRYDNKRRELIYGECFCGFISPSRRDENVARDDMKRHAEKDHRALYTKHLRDVERTLRIGRQP